MSEDCKQKADIILFPEMWNTGYQKFDPKKKSDYQKWLSLAITKKDSFIKKFQEQAKKT